MWFHFCYYVFFGVLVSSEVITLIKENKVTCVLTEDSVNSTLDVKVEDGFNNVHRSVKEINNWEISDWILENSTDGLNFGPVLDQRWVDFVAVDDEYRALHNEKSFSACSTTEWNIKVAAPFGSVSVTIPKHNEESSCSWKHYTLTKSGYRIILTSLKEEIFNKVLRFEPRWISFPNHINYKLHKYKVLFANTSSTEISQIMINSTKCIAFYASVDLGCYLNITLTSKHARKLITIDGFNKKNSLREWKKYEIRSEFDANGRLSFFRGRNDNSTIGFWSIDDIHICDPEIVIYEASINNEIWSNQTCTILNPTNSSNKFCNNSSFGKQCQIKCSTILGSSYSNCQKHRICLSENKCHCAWGYQGRNCSKECLKGSWGLDCNEMCNINCEICNRRIGCTKCKKKYFGESCAFELPVVQKPPTLESTGNSSVKISLNFEYEKNETIPELYVVQMKKLNSKEMFKNLGTVEDYPGNSKNVSLLINLTRECSYQIRVILISQNLSFEDDIVPSLIIYKSSLRVHHITKNDTVIVTWSAIERETVDNYNIHYECERMFCLNEMERRNNISNATAIYFNNNNFKICTFRLFATIRKRINFIDQTTVILQNSTKKIQDVELPKNVTLMKSYILFDLYECNKFSGPLNYSLELKCISTWCTDEATRIVSFHLNSYNANHYIGIENLHSFADYNVTIFAKRLDQEEMKRIYANKSTPSSEPLSVKELSVFSSDSNNLYMKWKEPYPPTGRIESYNVTLQHNTSITYTNVTFPCKIWSGFVCSNISRGGSSVVFNITVQSKNYDVSEWSAATNLLVALENVSNAPQNLKIKLNPQTSNDMILSWEHPVYTYGEIKTFHIIVDDGKEKWYLKKEVQSEKQNYNESVRIEYSKSYNVTVWAQNTYSSGKKATVYVVVSELISKFLRREKEYHPELFIVTIVLCIILLFIVLGFGSYYVYKRKKIILEDRNNTKIENICMSEIEEKQPLLQHSNKSHTPSIEISVSEFKNYLLTSLDVDVDDNKIIQQFREISKKDRRNSIYSEVNKNYDNLENSLLGIYNARERYINENYINSYEAPKAFLATKPPLGSIVDAFWSTVCQENVKTIIMLTKLEENGCVKCEKYWPDEQSRFRFGKFLTESVSVKLNSDYVHRVFKVKYDNQTRVIHHYQYVTWSNQNLPLSVKNFTSFVRELMEESREHPILIHCDEGWVRTGIYILCDMVLRMSIKEGKVDFFKALEQLTKQRADLISHLGQYIFCHFVVLEYYFGGYCCTSEGNKNFELKIQEAIQESSLKRLISHLAKVTEEYHISVKNSSAVLSDSISDNISAVTVDCFNYPKRFIVVKVPVSSTVRHFWNLVINYEIEIIVSLNQIDDKSKDYSRFWPNEAQQNFSFGESYKLVFLCKENTTDVYDTVTVKIKKIDKNQERIVKIINVKTWKSKSVTPLNIKDLLHVWDKIMLYSGQIVVTCCDGTTASGLFVALAYLLQKINTDRFCNVFSAARMVKQSCPHFVKNPKQIKFLYQAALEYIREFAIYEVVT